MSPLKADLNQQRHNDFAVKNSMEKEQAFNILNLESRASREEIDLARVTKRYEIEKLILNAPNSALKKKYKDDLNELELAYQVVLGSEAKHAPGMNVTRMRDRAGARVLYRETGDGTQERSLGISAGDVLLDNYEVRHLLGAGGTSAVFSAFDKELAQEVAIKVFLPNTFENTKRREEFLCTLEKVKKEMVHSGIVRPYDARFEGDFLVVGMELIRGTALDKEIAERRAKRTIFETEEILHWVKDLCGILVEAHKTMSHKNLKPANIFITREGFLKIADFGIGTFLSSEMLSKIAHILGRDYYLAPEQLQGGNVTDAKADQYALGILLYELFSGEPLPRRLPALKSIREDVPDELSAVLDRVLESDPSLRYRDMQEFGSAIENAGVKRTFMNTAAIPMKRTLETTRNRVVQTLSRPLILGLVLTSVIVMVYLAFGN